MIKIEYPQHPFRIKEETGGSFIFDEIRKQWVNLSPEEWVRQNILQYLIHVKKYPASLMAVEKEIRLGELKKRCDIIVYKDNLPWMIVECKEMNVPITDRVIEQVLRYNQVLRVNYLILTNGTDTYGMDTATCEMIHVLPEYT